MTNQSRTPYVQAFGSKWQPQYVTAQKLSVFLGIVGGNQFYLGNFWLGTLKLLLTLSVQGIPISGTWWLIDIFLIRSHRHDWSDWLKKRQNKLNTKKLKKEQAKQAAVEKKELVEYRKSNGLCLECGSDKLQAISDTYSKTSFGPEGHTSIGQVFSAAPGAIPTHQKVKTRLMIICLNCGFKRQT